MNEIITKIVGMLSVNCYLVPLGKKLYIIDPGAEADEIISAAGKFPGYEPVILLSHAHVDHIGAVGEVTKKLGVTQIYLNRADLKMYYSSNNHLLPHVPPAKDLPLPVHTLDTKDLTIIETPGHTLGSVCFMFEHLPALFSGDTLFASSIGRTDFPGGDYDTLIGSILEKLMILPDELRVYPGHGDLTSIGTERRNNPYLLV